MAKKVNKKVDFKKIAKGQVNKYIVEALKALGIEASDGEDYGFTEGTIVAHMEKTDIQIKLITPKAGLERYKRLEEEEE